MNAEEEQNLALRARTGDKKALGELVARLRAPLFALAFAEVRHYDDAQDVVAAALARICARIHTLREPAQARHWMNSVVRNEARRLLQSRQSGRVTSGGSVLEGAGVTCSPEEASLLRLDIEIASKRLPQDYARAVALFYLAGLSVAEIARRLDRPEGTIKYWLHRGRQQLAPSLEGYTLPMQNPSTPSGYSPQTTASPWIANIVSTNLSADLLRQMESALKRAGWDQINLIGDFAAAARSLKTGDGSNAELHMPLSLQGGCCVIMDERIGAHSAFELIALLSATAERKDFALFLLIDNAETNPDFDLTAMAAYATGVDMLLSKPFDIAEFERFGRRLRTVPPSTAPD